MPGFDGTGPMGMGPMTGGGMGFCAVPLRPAWPAYAEMGLSMPYAALWRMPYGGVTSFAPELAREEELEYLRRLAQSMRVHLQETETRIQQIESKKD